MVDVSEPEIKIKKSKKRKHKEMDNSEESKVDNTEHTKKKQKKKNKPKGEKLTAEEKVKKSKIKKKEAEEKGSDVEMDVCEKEESAENNSEMDQSAEKSTQQKSEGKSKEKSKRKLKKEKKQEREDALRVEAHKVAVEKAQNYLSKWKHARTEWKFEKVRQTWLINNLFNENCVSKEMFPTLLEYLEKCKGMARDELLKKGQAIIQKVEDDEENEDATESTEYKRARLLIQSLVD